jgi:hypothetical protein
VCLVAALHFVLVVLKTDSALIWKIPIVHHREIGALGSSPNNCHPLHLVPYFTSIQSLQKTLAISELLSSLNSVQVSLATQDLS